MKDKALYAMQPMHAASVNLTLVATANSFILRLCPAATLLQISNRRNVSFEWGLNGHNGAL